MPEIKSKPGMNAPKVRQTDAAPKEAAGILRQQYAEKPAERQPEAKGPVQYATDKVETDGRRGAVLAADGTRRAAQQVKPRRERREKAESTEPKKENAQPVSEWEPLPAEPQPDAAPPQPKQRPTAAPRPREQAPEPRPQQAMPKTRRSVEARQGADTPAPTAGQRRALQQRAKTRSGSAPQAEPARSVAQPMPAAPKVPQLRPEPVMPKTRPSADARTDADPEAPPLQEMRRQKVVQDTVRARQEARRSAEAEAVRANGPVKAEQGALHSGPERPTPFDRKSGITTHHQARHTTDRPMAKAGKGTPARLAGNHAPAKPAFALKERSAIGRQADKTLTPAARAKRMGEQKLREQAVRKNAETARRAAKRTAQMTARAAQAVVHAVKAAVSSVAALGGGAVLLVVLVVVALIAAIVASPFGIFFSNESASRDTVPISAAVAQVNFDFNAWLEALQGADTYDDITVEGSTADWAEILAVFATKVAGGDGADAADVATIDADRIDRLKAVFWDMNVLTSEVETIDHPDSDPDDNTDDSWTEKILHITVTPKAAADMPTAYGFTTRQTDAMNELLAERAMLTELAGSLTAYSAEAADIEKRLPDDLSPERREVVRVACSLVGKVAYFWGGKSLVIGWDSRWGTLQKVWADGSSTSGTYRPYGLDCSGFVDWTFYNATDGAYYPGHGGGATMQHTYCAPISWEDAQPGDLVFYPDDMHVGIVGCRDEDSNLLIIHCASSANGTVVTSVSGFTSIGRPMYYSD